MTCTRAYGGALLVCCLATRPCAAFELEPAPRPALQLRGAAGIAAQATAGAPRSHGLLGAVGSMHVWHVVAGALYERTDTGESEALAEPILERWTTAGGFLGAWLPYARWVDVEAEAGVARRTYANPSSLYGPAGFRVSSAALLFRLAVSDRAGARLLGPRLGAALVATVDLALHAPAWTRRFTTESGEVREVTGTTPIGGTSIALVLEAGFDVGGASRER